MLMCAKRSFLCGGLEAASEKTAIQTLSMVETFCVSVDEENGRFCAVSKVLVGFWLDSISMRAISATGTQACSLHIWCFHVNSVFSPRLNGTHVESEATVVIVTTTARNHNHRSRPVRDRKSVV